MEVEVVGRGGIRAWGDCLATGKSSRTTDHPGEVQQPVDRQQTEWSEPTTCALGTAVWATPLETTGNAPGSRLPAASQHAAAPPPPAAAPPPAAQPGARPAQRPRPPPLPAPPSAAAPAAPGSRAPAPPRAAPAQRRSACSARRAELSERWRNSRLRAGWLLP